MSSYEYVLKAQELVNSALKLAKEHNCYDFVIGSSAAGNAHSKSASYLKFIVGHWERRKEDKSSPRRFSDDELWAYLCEGFRLLGKIESANFGPKADELLLQLKSSLAKKAAEARHSAPGGARDRAQAIRDVWASGKYTSRDLCAEQESAALGMSFSTARKALRGVPVSSSARGNAKK